MFRSVDAKDHMTKAPVTVKPSTPIFEAIEALLARKISGATVVDDDNNVVGVISEMDCLKAILSGTYHGEAGGTVAEIMTTTVETADPDAGIMAIAKQLIDGHRRRLPVTKDGKFLGQFSCRSILRAVVEFAGEPEDPKH